MTAYTKSPKMYRVRAMYTSLMNRVVSGIWTQGWTREEFKTIGANVCEFKEEVVEPFHLCARKGYTQ